MSSQLPGSNTSQITVTDIAPLGIWVLISDEELFLPFEQFPWFKKATVEQILNVVEEHPGSFHWPDLDVDLGLESMRHPEKFPLRARVDPKKPR